MMTIQLFIVWVNVRLGLKISITQCNVSITLLTIVRDDSVKSKAQAYIELLNDNSEDNG